MSDGRGERLERALAAFLRAQPTTRAEQDALLQRHPDLADLLTPMLDPGQAPATGSDEAGQRVLGDFRLVREIGRGGMGVVYEAWQRSLDRRVAVKLLAPGQADSASALARFRREAAAAGRVRHPNIVEVLGFGSEGNEHYFAMQFVDGAPLHAVSERFRAPAAAVELCAQVAAALAAAHAAGLVHRDVKPGNVLVQADGTPLLTDFGVARDTSLPTLTRDGSFLGTLAYAAPEQLRGEEVDAATDVFALGVMLYELLTGRHPFDAPTPEATTHRILSEDPPALRGHPGISDDLAAVVDRMLVKERKHRYASAAPVHRDLAAIEHGDPVSVRLPTAIERLRRWTRREPWRAFAAAVVLVALPAITGAVGYLWANAPRIAAATAAEQRASREEALATALLAIVEHQSAAGFAAIASLPADDAEAAITRALLHGLADDAKAANAALVGLDGPEAALVRAWIERPNSLPQDLETPAADAFGCFVRVQLLREAALKRGENRPLLRRAFSLAQQTIVLAATPRLCYTASIAVLADALEDKVTLRGATTALASLFPDSRAARYFRARSLVRYDANTALALLDELDAVGGPTHTTLQQRAIAYEGLGRLDDAVRANRAAIALVDGAYRPWQNLAACLRKQKATAEAEDALREALRRYDLDPSLWNQLGLVLRDAGKPEEAVTAFEHALELSPDYSSAALNLGNLHLRNKDLGLAEEAFRRAIAGDAQNSRAVANLGDVLARAGRHEEALQWSLRAATLAPNELIPNHNVANEALLLGLPRLALSFATRARDVAAKDGDALAIYARALLAQVPVDGSRALAAAKAADEATGGRNIDVRILVAKALAATGAREAALELLDKGRSDAALPQRSRDKLAEAAQELRGK